MKVLAVCATCRLEQACEWSCPICEQAGLRRVFCSRRCRHVHRKDGRHRLEAQKALARGGVAPPPKRRGVRVQVQIVRRGTSAAERKERRKRPAPPES